MNQEINERVLDLELDKTKSKVFILNNAAFLGCMLANITFRWDDQIPTASIGNNLLSWNPRWFLSLVPETRKTVLVHEIWHEALLHGLRRQTRDPKIWNYACDIFINNKLEDEGYSFVGVETCWKDQQFRGMNEEAIYDILMKNAIEPPPSGSWGVPEGDEGDMQNVLGQEGNMHQAVNNVMRAAQQARIAKQAGSIPGNVIELLNRFLRPKVAWESLLRQFFTDLNQDDYTWARPNRRYQNIYLPSIGNVENKLAHLIYYQDVSGSVTTNDMIRFNSEVKYVKETFKPEKMTIVQFDHKIQSEIVINDGDDFSEIKIVGRGGTSFVPVRNHIEKHRPTAAMIFTDLECTAMEPPSYPVPIIWIAVNTRNYPVKVGKVIHIKD